MRMFGSVGVRVTLIAVGLTSALLIVSAMLQANRIETATEDLALGTMQAIGEDQAGTVSRRLDQVALAARGIANTLEALIVTGQTDRDLAIQTLRLTMENAPDLAGAWAGFEPDAFDGRDAEFVDADVHHDSTGRFIAYFYNFGAGVEPHRLIVYDAEHGDTEEATAYYQVPLRTAQPFTTDPVAYDIEGNNVLLISTAIPITVDGRAIGVAGVDYDLSALSAELLALRPYEVGTVALIADNGEWVAHPDADRIGQQVGDDSPAIAAAARSADGAVDRVEEDGIVHLLVPVPLLGVEQPWSVVISVPQERLTAEARALRQSEIISGLILLIALGLGLTLLANRMISRPLARSTRAIAALEAGELDAAVAGQDRKDEIGAINRALDSFRKNEARMRQMEAEKAQAAAETAEAQAAARRELAESFEATVGNIVGAVGQSAETMRETADALESAATVSTDRAAGVTVAAEGASANVQMVATATEELSASIREISDQVQRSADAAKDAVAEASQTNDMVQGLAAAADRIGEVTGLITTIANQTNLLALNATIEAARAGDAGKGFAVVANEVKALASQTARATDEITQQIESIQTETRRSVDAIGGVSKTIAEVETIATSIASAIEEQSVATRDISANVAEAARSTEGVAEHIGALEQAADNTQSNAHTVKDAAAGLSDHAAALSNASTGFIGTLTAA